ncbi:MAG: DUF6969 family protein [Alphaproteobacteria bacterium]
MKPVDFSALSQKDLEEMRDAGDRIRECYRVLAKTDDNIVGELLKGAETFYEWNHYPDGDVYDRDSHSQYYYHAHAAGERPGEHGHFHAFLRPKGMPAGIEPAYVQDYGPPEDPDDALSHLVAISMDPKGFPIKLFTTNRWVTGEIWYAGSDVCRLLPYFAIEHAQPSWPVNVWITNMLVLFRPQIRQLVEARDVVVETWGRSHPSSNVFEDRGLEVTAESAIDVDRQLDAVGNALALRRGSRASRRVR